VTAWKRRERQAAKIYDGRPHRLPRRFAAIPGIARLQSLKQMAGDSPQRGALASQINVTPLVDVMLVLLIIFMVTAPIIQQGVEVNLPKVKAQALPGKEEQFIVSITRDRELYLNDTRITADELSDKLRAISTARPDRQVFLRADDAVPYGEVVRTMAAIKAAGIDDVGMVTGMPADSDNQAGAGSGSKHASPGP
jgi:biopolymer transport protein TolR